jgi:hypothetical protein
MSNPLQILLGIVIVFLLPGYTLIYRIALGMGMSVIITIMVGFGLNAISSEEHGYVTPGPLWALLLLTTVVFTLVGWLRGAYPSAGYLNPSLYRPPPSSKDVKSKSIEFDRKRRLDKYIREREELLADLRIFSDRSTTSNPQRKLYYRRRIDQTRERINTVNEEIHRLGSEVT